MSQLHQTIEAFWKWAGYTPEEYSQIHCMNLKRDGREECDFPEYGQMASLANALLKYDTLSARDMDDFLTAMAINGESGWIKDECAELASPSFLRQAVEQGYQHIQPETRAQIAELLHRRKPEGYMTYIQQLLNDPVDYVRRCAKYADL